MPNLNVYEQPPIEDIVGREPAWIIRSGISLIFIVFFCLLLMTWFITYPDTIVARIELTTKSPPAPLVAKVSARIEKLFVKNNQQVTINQPLLLLDSDTSYASVVQLKAIVENLSSNINDSTHLLDGHLLSSMNEMGELQLPTNQLKTALDDYFLFTQSKQIDNQLAVLESVNNGLLALAKQLASKKAVWLRKMAIEENRFETSKQLKAKGVISEKELSPIENQYLNQKLALDEINIQIELNEIRLNENTAEITKLKLRNGEERKRLRNKISRTKQSLLNEISRWENLYLLRSPRNGEVSFSQFWSINQHVNRGEIAVTVVGSDSQKIGKLSVSHRGAGKIIPGQRVEIELDSFPSVEFGKISGKVAAISAIPDDKGYRVDVDLKDELITSYNQRLSFKPSMVGTAKIVTKEKRLIERFFDKIIYSFDKG